QAPVISSIMNPGFESGTTPWKFYTNGAGTFSMASPGYEENNAARLALSSGGSNIQLYQEGITLEPNTRYRLSFAAYSTTGHDVTVRLLKHVSPYTAYAPDFTANLGTSWQTFTTEFTSSGFTGTVNDGRLQFWLTAFAASGDNYYIDDVRLEIVNEADTTPPIVNENEPRGTNVPVTTQINVTFSETMDQTSVESAFSMSPLTAGSFSWNGDTVTYTPASDLAFDTTYTVNIGTGAMDMAGNLLELPHGWEFKTEHENIPPTVTDNTPTGTSVPVTAQVTVTFSETMDQTSVESALSTSPAMKGTFNWNGSTVTYTPASDLAFDTTYTVKIGKGAMDMADNNMQTKHTWKFTTEVVQTSNNLILNPGFESGTTPWLFYTNGKGTFVNDASGTERSHAGHIVISQKGSNVQLYQPDLVFEPNTLYRLSFKAYSNTGHDLSISLHKHGSPYTNYGLSDYLVNLGTSWSEYSTQFTTSGFSGTVNDGRLKFYLVPYNAIEDQYFIDDIILVKV
ncbi:MAG: Ig-like domain-containing protein, partial [Methanosarcinales archaeon]|nr:Ig-like domain-containing protein [Methanosarcinales archaeon]